VTNALEIFTEIIVRCASKCAKIVLKVLRNRAKQLVVLAWMYKHSATFAMCHFKVFFVKIAT
jgi:hypothetical protein